MYKIITSKENPLIKRICQLNKKQMRYESGLFLLDGEKLTLEAIRSHVEFKYAFFSENIKDKYSNLIKNLDDIGAEIYFVSDSIIDKLSYSETPQGIICVCKLFHTFNISEIIEGKYLALSHISDPGNMGAIIRCTEAMGLDGLIITQECTDIYSQKVIRGSMGSAFRVKTFVSYDLVNDLNNLKKSFNLYSAEVNENAFPVNNVDFSGNCITVIGNESAGVPVGISSICNKIYIPMKGSAESLNASVAAGIIAWEMKHANEEKERL